MYYIFPDYINEFCCVADACTDTCCAQWQTVIDDQSLKRYMKYHGRYRFTLTKNINFPAKTFRKTKEGRCTFLRDNNLCDMYINMGPEAMCRTCRNYPKHVEKFDNIREVNLSMSCPEAARILMNRTLPVRFVSRTDDIQEDEDPLFDPLMYSAISGCRDEITGILQNRDLKMQIRAALLYAICCDLQVMIRDGYIFNWMEVFEKYKSSSAVDYVKSKTASFTENKDLYYNVMRKTFLNLYECEPLRDEWTGHLLQTEMLLYNPGAGKYMDLVTEFRAWQAENDMWDIWMEQLLVYFIAVYFTRAAYDADVFSKMSLALKCISIIHELAFAYWLRNRKQLSSDDMVRIVYRFSREIEHSRRNLSIISKARFGEDK